MNTYSIILMITNSFITAIVEAYDLYEVSEWVKTNYPNAQIVETTRK